MYLDDERNIVSLYSSYREFLTIEMFPCNNSFIKRIDKCLSCESNFIADNGKTSLPPDFYSPEFNLMFDVFRVCDSEVRKGYDPVRIRERELYNKIKREHADVLSPTAEVFVSCDIVKQGLYTYKYYVKQFQRVSSEHLKKLHLWTEKHPDIRYKGLFVFDETDVYFEGASVPSGKSEPGHEWFRVIDRCRGFHKPWLDERMVRSVYESEIDFIVWLCIGKPYGVADRLGIAYPHGAIIDARYGFSKYVDYPISLVS